MPFYFSRSLKKKISHFEAAEELKEKVVPINAYFYLIRKLEFSGIIAIEYVVCWKLDSFGQAR